MPSTSLEALVKQLLQGNLALDGFRSQATSLLQREQARSAELGEATLDLDRGRRCGFPEVVYGEGKSVPTLSKIFQRLLDERISVLATRISSEKADQLQHQFPNARYNEMGRIFRIDEPGANVRCGFVPVVTAGTSDLPVAEEARETIDWMGVHSTLITDVGVAGPHRLLAHVDTLQQASAVVVVAGMEGALPSVVGGHVPCPVIGVPTSVGYGASLGGFAALLSMLNSCAANVTVVNIDAGFKAGYLAGMIARRSSPPAN